MCDNFATSVSVRCKPQGLPTTQQPDCKGKNGGASDSRSGTKAPRWGKTVRLAKVFSVITAPRKSNVTTSVPALTECA